MVTITGGCHGPRPPIDCCTEPDSGSCTMSRELLDRLGEKILFDSHCHMDFILFWKSPEMEFEYFDQFVQAYPLMEDRCLEGFITNFCCPEIWMEHLASPSPLIHSLLSRPSVYYTIGCHPHYAMDLMPSHMFAQLEILTRVDKKQVCAREGVGKKQLGIG